MSVKDMDFEKHSASYFGVILNKGHSAQPCDYTGSHKQLQRNCSKPFQLPVQQLGELVTFYDLLDLRSNLNTSLDLCLVQLWKKNLEVLESC